jgi:hypothetical protein
LDDACAGVVNRVSGTEQLWINWSIETIAELEKLTEYAIEKYKGRIDSDSDAQAVRLLLSKLKQSELSYDQQRHAVLRGEGNVLARRLLLRHL